MIFQRLRSVVEALHRAKDPINGNDRFGALARAWGYVFNNKLHGDYYEFGVYRGDSLLNSFSVYRKYKNWLGSELHHAEEWRRKSAALFAEYEAEFYGLDTFEGMPDNKEGNPIFSPGFFKTSLEAVRRRCASVGIPDERLHLMKGLFNATGSELLASNPRPAAIINLDCDLYASAKDALAVCQHLIQDGTVLLSDDYNTFCASPEKGERKALEELREETGIQFEPWFPYQFCAQAFLCHRSRSHARSAHFQLITGEEDR